jgi:putative ABC transport system permease protein
MDLQISPEILLQGLALAIAAALLAGVYPALKMARTSPAEALRTE